MLYEKLIEYSSSGVYPMHMPGHKRIIDKTTARLPYDIDITEINGFDNLQNPQGLLLETAKLAASIYGSDNAFLLVGGSSVGMLAAIGAHVPRGGKLLVSRNSHISVHNAIALFGLHPVYINPDADETTGIPINIPPDTIRDAIAKEPDIKAVVITSPTYEGFISDIKTIAYIAHSNDIPLIVDSAHGAHLGFSPDFPISAIKSGADVVVMSLHKTLPALTQCALLHTQGTRVNTREITRLLSVFQTTSPSYILMASIDHCLHIIASGNDSLFKEYNNKLNRFGSAVSHLKHINVIGYSPDSMPPHTFSFDRSKLIIAAAGTTTSSSSTSSAAAAKAKVKVTAFNGIQLAEALRNKYRIEVEASSINYILAMTSICDSADGLKRLADALCTIDKEIDAGFCDAGVYSPVSLSLQTPPMLAVPQAALSVPGHEVTLESAFGLMSLEYVWAYPPGIPLIVPGEMITAELISHLDSLQHCGVELKSTYNALPLILAAGN